MGAPQSNTPLRAEDCFVLGYVARAHGLQGEVKVVLDVQDASVYADLKQVWLQVDDRPLSAKAIEKLQLQPSGPAIVRFAGVADKDAADELTGATLMLPLTQLPPPAPGSFYYFEINGFAATDAAGHAIGTIREVLEMPAQDLLRIDHSSGKEVLVPIRPEFLGALNRAAKTLVLHLPPGLLEVYLGTGADDTNDDAGTPEAE
jgi:16S rRNA processing protein RimM